jgi:hypothetical protein
MARRKTIGKDPLAGLSDEPDKPAEIAVPIATAHAILAASPSPEEWPRGRFEPSVAGQWEGRGAIGGKLEFLGGDFVGATCLIWRFGPSARIGFISPKGGLVDLGAELEGIVAWPDRGDRPIVGAVGWGIVVGSLAGVIGVAAGAGLRLLVPRRMMARIRLRHRGEVVVRTDYATVSALEAMACAHHRARSTPA